MITSSPESTINVATDLPNNQKRDGSARGTKEAGNRSFFVQLLPLYITYVRSRVLQLS